MARVDWRRPPLLDLEEGKVRYKMIISYDGRAFNGWQTQKNGMGVQQVIEKALKKMLNEEVKVIGSGRTDSGVHAMGQVCHYDIIDRQIPAKAFLNVINCNLPPTVRVLDCEKVDGLFHSRYTAYARKYRYYLKRENEMTATDNGFVAKIKRFPSIDLLNSYARHIVGTHDFSTFVASKDMSPSKCRDMYESYWAFEKDKWGYDVLTYTICGNAFLYKMVRSIVGTQLDFAMKNKTSEEFKAALESKNRKMAERTANPNGLFLLNVSYDENEYKWFEDTAIPLTKIEEDNE
ncbi:MAG: tRNA pseudouridine(38-40) synthase TruA [Pleomorphochaeta sp.]